MARLKPDAICSRKPPIALFVPDDELLFESRLLFDYCVELDAAKSSFLTLFFSSCYERELNCLVMTYLVFVGLIELDAPAEFLASLLSGCSLATECMLIAELWAIERVAQPPFTVGVS